VEGDILRRKVEFSHLIPDPPVITAPEAAVDPDHAEICWEPVTTPAGVQIAGYQVIVDSLDITLPASATCLQIPPGFLESGSEYGFEVLSIEENHNQTITAGSFETI
jgi:hypothetical protein